MQDKLDEVLESYKQILTIVREVYPPATEGRILTAIGITYQHQGQYRRALEAYDQALAIARQEDDRVGETIISQQYRRGIQRFWRIHPMPWKPTSRRWKLPARRTIRRVR